MSFLKIFRLVFATDWKINVPSPSLKLQREAGTPCTETKIIGAEICVEDSFAQWSHKFTRMDAKEEAA